jgi:hypothetical protein
MLQIAGCTTDEASLRRYLDAIVAVNQLVRPQDQNTALNSAITRNEVNTLRAFEWVKDNIPEVTNM